MMLWSFRDRNRLYFCLVGSVLLFTAAQLLFNVNNQTQGGFPTTLPTSVTLKTSAQASQQMPAATQNHNVTLFTQENIDYMAANMEVRLEVTRLKRTRITLHNKGNVPISHGPWAVYFCTIAIIPETHKSVKLIHINGCLHKFEPVPGLFKPITFGQSCTVEFQSFSRARTDTMPNWYVAASGLQPRTILNTIGEELSFVDSSNKLTWDQYNNAPNVPDLAHAPVMVTPTPKELIREDSTKVLTIEKSDWLIYGDKGLENEVKFLAGKLGLKVFSSSSERLKVISLSINPSDRDHPLPFTAHESYNLHVNTSRQVVNISGYTPTGVFYGVQTLLALINEHGQVPQVSIADYPRFAYRGLMVDVGRYFIPKKEILKTLDVMAMYKMNKFHFHLSENEGWRLEIPELEELTSVGSKRCHDLQEKSCILHQLGSGPDTPNLSNGYYSVLDYREILRYANERHIQVIPEFDMPGHSHASIKSMIARYDRLVKQGNNKEASKFLLNDFEDRSEYLSTQKYKDEAANPCINSTYTFLNHILSVLEGMHSEVQPLNAYFFGGDEVVRGAWKESPACKQFFTNSTDDNEPVRHKLIMQHFIKKTSQMIQDYGLQMAGWSDAFFDQNGHVLPRKTFKIRELVAYYWRVSNDIKRLQSLLSEGYKVVLTPPDIVYFDHPHEPDYEERGKYWATPSTSSRKVFNFSPLELNKANNNESHHIIGIEGCVWTETIRTADQMYSMLFPRLLALAERSWHQAPWEGTADKVEKDRERAKDWENFANTLVYRELKRLDKIGVGYRVPPPGARVIDKKLKVKTMLPGLKVEYSTDKGVTWKDVVQETDVDGKVLLRTRSVDNKRFSRVIEVKK